MSDQTAVMALEIFRQTYSLMLATNNAKGAEEYMRRAVDLAVRFEEMVSERRAAKRRLSPLSEAEVREEARDEVERILR